MQSQSQQPIHTFCIGFQEPSYDESAYANAVARHLGTQHVAWRVTAHEAQQVIPRLSGVFDEPFADSSQIPTYLVSQLARSDVVVSLSGDGGDELFGGYTRYFTVARFAAWRDRLPRGTRPALTGILRRLPLNRLRVLGRLIQIKDFPELYRQLNRHWDEPELLVVGSEAGEGLYDRHDTSWLGDNSLERMMLLDSVTYLPDDILVKVDRSSMAHGLEARVPLLDHRIFEFAWSLPSHWRASGGEGKWLLRQVLQRYVPRELFQRPKVGFGVPLDAWLRGPLREWAEELLRAERLDREGFFNSRPIRDRWQQHLDRRGDWHYWLWDILMFQTWLERWK